MELLDVTKCSNFREKETYSRCTAYEKLSLNCNCFENNRCPYRIKYYKAYPQVYIQFGKYKYYKYTELPSDYVAWLLKQNLKDDLRRIIEDSILKGHKEELINMYIEKNYVPRHTNSDLDYWGFI